MKIFLLCFLLILFPISSQAQFIGIKIGMPPGINSGGLNPAISGGGGSGNLTFLGNTITFNGNVLTFLGD